MKHTSQNFLPVRWITETSKIRLELAGENLKSCGFADTVGSDETKNLPWTRSGQSVELEGVCAVSVGDLRSY